MKIIKSKRKSISVEINSDAEVIVRAPLRMTNRQIAEFVEKHQSFIDKSIAKMKKRRESLGNVRKLTEGELEELVQKAARIRGAGRARRA